MSASPLTVRGLLEELNRLVKEDGRVGDAFVFPYISGVENDLPLWVNLKIMEDAGEVEE